MVILFSFTLLFGCGAPSSDGSEPTPVAESITDTEDTLETPEASLDEVSSTVKAIDGVDANAYYVIIDGVSYDLTGGTKVSDLLAAGYVVKDYDISQEMQANTMYIGDGLFDSDIAFYKEGVEKPYFYAYIENKLDTPVVITDTTIRAFEFFNVNADIVLTGNIRIGTAIEEVKSVWGMPEREGAPSSGKYLVYYSYGGLDTFIGTFGFSVSEETNEIKRISITYDVIY